MLMPVRVDGDREPGPQPSGIDLVWVPGVDGKSEHLKGAGVQAGMPDNPGLGRRDVRPLRQNATLIGADRRPIRRPSAPLLRGGAGARVPGDVARIAAKPLPHDARPIDPPELLTAVQALCPPASLANASQ